MAVCMHKIGTLESCLQLHTALNLGICVTDPTACHGRLFSWMTRPSVYRVALGAVLSSFMGWCLTQEQSLQKAQEGQCPSTKVMHLIAYPGSQKHLRPHLLQLSRCKSSAPSSGNPRTGISRGCILFQQ